MKASLAKKCSKVNAETGQECANTAAPKHPWCNKCQAVYQKNRDIENDNRTQALWFCRGVEADRNSLIQLVESGLKRAFIPERTLVSLPELIDLLRKATRPTYQAGASVDPNGTRILN